MEEITNITASIKDQIDKLHELENKTEQNSIDKRSIDFYRVNIVDYHTQLMNRLGLSEITDYLKEKKLHVTQEDLCSCFKEEDVKYQVEAGKVRVIYGLKVGDDKIKVIYFFYCENDWISCKAYTDSISFKGKSNLTKVYELLNNYNLNTCHSKACLSDGYVSLARHDDATIFYSLKDLKSILFKDILIMFKFFEDNYSKLKELSEEE